MSVLEEKREKSFESACPRGGVGSVMQAELETPGFVFDIKRYAIHDGPGIRTTVFFKGCPLKCQWCHNPESWKAAPEVALRTSRCKKCGQCVRLCSQNAISFDGDLPKTDPEKCTLCGECIEPCPGGAREIIGSQTTVGEVMAEIEKDVIFYDQSGGGVTFSGGEPLAQPEFLIALLNQCRNKGIHTAVDTSCYARGDVLDMVARASSPCKHGQDGRATKPDLFLCDIKHMNSETHRQFTGVENTLILDNIRRLSEQGRRIIIRIPIIPGFNDDATNIEATAGFAATLSGVKKIDILPYNRGGSEKSMRLAGGAKIMRTETPSDRKMNAIAERLGGYGFKVKIGG
jgi:pyruvate formate lyase activating enzyme